MGLLRLDLGEDLRQTMGLVYVLLLGLNRRR